ncbi:MAG: hypothetical protein ACXVRV_02715 [Gaiellaceae bacterium]
MSFGTDAPLPGVDGWSVRTCLVGGREQHWLERTIDAATGHVEQFYGHYEYASRSNRIAARPRTAAPAAPVVRTRPVRTVERPAAPVELHTTPCGLTVRIGTRALQGIHEEIQAHLPGIDVLGYETGGGIFGPPIRSWPTCADVAIATVAAGTRRRNAVEIAYGKIEATEASLRARSRRTGRRSTSERSGWIPGVAGLSGSGLRLSAGAGSRRQAKTRDQHGRCQAENRLVPPSGRQVDFQGSAAGMRTDRKTDSALVRTRVQALLPPSTLPSPKSGTP